MKTIITEKEKITNVLQTYPHLKERLIQRCSCKFMRLRNVLRLSTIAKSATVLDAAHILEENLDEFLEFLNAAIGLKEEYLGQKSNLWVGEKSFFRLNMCIDCMCSSQICSQNSICLFALQKEPTA